MTITRVTDDPGTTPFAVERSTPDAHRWLVWALLVEIPLDHGTRPDIMGAPLGRMEIRRTGRDDIMGAPMK